MNENLSNTKASTSSKKLNHGLLRCIGALLLAVVLLWVSALSIVDLLNGPTESEAFQNEEPGAFVNRDIYVILGFYADEVSSGGQVTSRYAVVPMGGKLVSVKLTKRYLESAQAVCDDTYAYINGDLAGIDRYFVVQGTVSEMSEESSALMYDWYGVNKDQLVEIGMVGETDDYADYLSDTVLLVDTVNGHSQNTVIALTIAAAVLFLYVLVELVLMGTGFYLPKPEKVTNSGEDSESEEESGDEGEPNEDGESKEEDKSDEESESDAESNPDEEKNTADGEADSAETESGENEAEENAPAETASGAEEAE